MNYQCRDRRLRQITQTLGWITHDITKKTELNNCFIVHILFNLLKRTLISKSSKVWVSRYEGPPGLQLPSIHLYRTECLICSQQDNFHSLCTDHPPCRGSKIMEKIEINEYPFESDLVLNALTSKKLFTKWIFEHLTTGWEVYSPFKKKGCNLF